MEKAAKAANQLDQPVNYVRLAFAKKYGLKALGLATVSSVSACAIGIGIGAYALDVRSVRTYYPLPLPFPLSYLSCPIDERVRRFDARSCATWAMA